MTPIEELQVHLMMMFITFNIAFPVMYHYMKKEKDATPAIIAFLAFLAFIASFAYAITLFCLVIVGLYELFRYIDRKIISLSDF